MPVNDENITVKLLQDILQELQEIRRYLGYLGNHLQSSDKIWIERTSSCGSAVSSVSIGSMFPQERRQE